MRLAASTIARHIDAHRVWVWQPWSCTRAFKDVAKEDKSDTTNQSLRCTLLSCSCDFQCHTRANAGRNWRVILTFHLKLFKWFLVQMER